MTLSNVDEAPSTSNPSAACPVKPTQPTSSSAKQDSDDKATRNVMKTFGIVTSSYFVCWLPPKVYILMYMFGQISTFGHLYQATLIIMFLICCINPFIYIAKYDAFRKGMAMLFRLGINNTMGELVKTRVRYISEVYAMFRFFEEEAVPVINLV